MGVPSLGALTLQAILQRTIAQQMPGAQVRIEGNHVIIFIPQDTIIKMVKERLPEPYRSATEIRQAPGGVEILLRLR